MNICTKNIVLTGASSGIGASILALLVKFEGVKIIAVARNVEPIPQLDGVVFPFSANLAEKDQVDSLFDYANSVFETVDIFIANAGFAYFEKADIADWTHNQKIVDLNLLSPIYSLQKFEQQRKSNIDSCFVFMVSGVVNIPLPYYALYCSTKSALHQFVETYRYELKDDFLRLISVYPIATRTSFFLKASETKKTILPFLTQSAEIVAQAVIDAIKYNRKKVYPSFLFRIFIFFSRFFPFLKNLYSLNEKSKTSIFFSKKL